MRENQNDKINTEVKKKKKNAELWLRNGLTKNKQKTKRLQDEKRQWLCADFSQ